ncbi:MAG: aminotransferase class I/II-fold pyridoxal phosphate-dependent enzyme [Methanobacteriota archaeon]|nr:MAG: aminotransferase class I/II-fold pyridoxal phosphate-dependent enzyme [Euryarchaeota archaeon]
MEISPFLIERFFAEFEFSVPYMLSGSDAESFTIREVLELDGQFESNLSRFLGLKLSYTESKGDPQLRKSISRLYSSITEDQILVFSGAEEGIFAFMAGFLQQGDHLIVQFPCYQSLYEIAKANGVEISYWMLEEENQWSPDFNKLPDLIQSNTRAIMVNHPNNPTGYLPTRNDLDKLIEICRNNDLFLFSDEVYRLSEHSLNSRLPTVADLYPKGISLGVMSKPLGLPGLRIGWIATQSREIMAEIEAFKDYTTICNSAPSEFLATLALQSHEKILQRNLGIAKSNLKLLKKFMKQYSDLFHWIEPKAGNIGFVKCLFTDDAEQFCLNLLKTKGVLLLPSTKYGFGNSHFRIGFGRADFPQGLQKLEEYVVENLR